MKLHSYQTKHNNINLIYNYIISQKHHIVNSKTTIILTKIIFYDIFIIKKEIKELFTYFYIKLNFYIYKSLYLRYNYVIK